MAAVQVQRVATWGLVPDSAPFNIDTNDVEFVREVGEDYLEVVMTETSKLLAPMPGLSTMRIKVGSGLRDEMHKSGNAVTHQGVDGSIITVNSALATPRDPVSQFFFDRSGVHFPDGKSTPPLATIQPKKAGIKRVARKVAQVIKQP